MSFPSLATSFVSWQTNRNDKAQEFFAKQATELQNQAEWKDWFVLPFLPSPDTNPTFATYFSRQWADTFIISLHNFLSVLFQCMHILSAACGSVRRLRDPGMEVSSHCSWDTHFFHKIPKDPSQVSCERLDKLRVIFVTSPGSHRS